MKIKKIEFQNFRNFKGRNTVICSTDEKVTIVYGRNGDGKTTLHQLFQWVFYNRVTFNKTTTDKMYNLEFERDQEYGKTFSVWGCIDFEHGGESYSLRREWIYKKGLDDSKKFQENISLNKKDEDNNWNRLPNPVEVIEELLPSGLAEYFFFNGESMIADLRVKGKESANKLRKALYSIFDLIVLENAVAHIGSTELKTTVLGQLFLSKANIGSNSDINVLKTNIENAQNKIDILTSDLNMAKAELQSKRDFIQKASEQIGSTKSKREYELQRKALKGQRDALLELAKTKQSAFGEEIIESFPRLLISKTLANAKQKITLKADQNKLLSGINKQLIDALMKSPQCLCGRPICDNEREHLTTYLPLLPPNYGYIYDNFVKTSNSWGRKYDREKIESYIIQVLKYRDQAAECDKKIRNLDEDEKSGDQTIQDLIDDRQRAENRILELDESIRKLSDELAKYNMYLRAQMKRFDTATSLLDENLRINEKIEIMEAVKAEFEHKLHMVSFDYSKKLQDEIQILLDRMLTSKRSVTVSPDFFVRVFDSYDDESKSEGQFAIVSFAYIGGIFKLLKGEAALKTKEYPLVLDGPFSKLGDDHRKNVISTIPDYAPQIIIFSKDNLQNDFAPEKIGHIWTISSNEEKNVASVEEGFLW